MKNSIRIIGVLAVVAIVFVILGIYSYWGNQPSEPAPAAATRQQPQANAAAQPPSTTPSPSAAATPAPPAVVIDEAALHPREVSLANLAPVDTGASVKGTPPVVTTTTRAIGYAAMMPIPEDAKRGGPAIVEITLRVTIGKVGVGLLTKDQTKAVSYTQIAQSEAPATVKFKLPSLGEVGFLLIGNARETDGTTSTAEIDSVKILQ